MLFNAPVPGESLTREKGNAPWEQPPQYNTVEEVTNYYLDKLDDDDDLVEETLFLLKQGFPLDLFVNSLLLNGEMNGRHSYDVSYMVGPILHEHLLSLAMAAGIEVEEFQGATASVKKKQKTIQDLKVMLEKAGPETSELKTAIDTLPEAVKMDVENEEKAALKPPMETEEPTEEPAMQAPTSKGLMARRPTNV